MPNVEVIGVGTIEFPDSMSRDEIAAAIQRNLKRSAGPAAPVVIDPNAAQFTVPDWSGRNAVSQAANTLPAPTPAEAAVNEAMGRMAAPKLLPSGQMEDLRADLQARRSRLSSPEEASAFNRDVQTYNTWQDQQNFDPLRLVPTPGAQATGFPDLFESKLSREEHPLLAPLVERVGQAWNSYLRTEADAAGKEAALLQAGGKAVGEAMHRGSQVSRAVVGDWMKQASDTSPQATQEAMLGLPYGTLHKVEPNPNLAAFTENPNATLPIDKEVAAMPAAQRLAAKAALGAAGALPQIGAAAGLGMLGVPAVPANLAVMGLDQEGRIDPVGVLAAAGLPVSDKLGRGFFNLPWVKNEIQKFAPEELKAMFSRVNAGTGSANDEELVRLINAKLGKAKSAIESGAEISRPRISSVTGEKAAEIASGQLANNIYLLGVQAPQIMSSDNPPRALEDAVVGNLAISFLGAGELHGERQAGAKAAFERRGVRVPGQPVTIVPTVTTAPPERIGYAPHQEQEQSSVQVQPQGGDSGGQTTQAGPGHSLPGSGGEPPAPAPPAPRTPPVSKPPELLANGVVVGAETHVRGANDTKFEAHYAWVPESLIQPSHVGENFSPNPLYAPLRNTRDYEKDLAEREKVLAGAQNFDPEAHLTNTKSAAEGPVMLAQGNDGVYRVMGGNGREQMIRRLPPQKRDALRQVEDQEAGFFGLPPRPAADARIVRLLPPTNLATPEGIQAAHRTVDLLNPSPGLVETTSKMAENDAAKVPPHALNLVTPQSSPGLMRQWMQRLIADGVLDRNTRTQILASDEQVTGYVQRLLVQAAYQDNHVSNVRNAPRALETARGLIDSAVPLLISLRQAGPEGAGVANAFTEMIRRVADFQNQYPDRKLHQVLKTVADQAETHESREIVLARALAASLASRVELLPQNKRGERKIDADETLRSFHDLLYKMGAAIRQNSQQGAGDLLGSRDVFSIVSDFLRADLGDQPTVLREGGDFKPTPQLFEVNPALARWRALMKAKEKNNGKLTQAHVVELEELERVLGQAFLDFYRQHQASTMAAGENKAELEARAKARLAAGPLETQGDLIDNGPQLTLFEGRSGYFPGFDVPVNPVNDDEPKINTLIEGPKARSERGNRQLQLGGLDRAGVHARPGGGAIRREVIGGREEFIPSLPPGYLKHAIPGTRFANLRVLRPHQIEGVARVLWAFSKKQNFGLFDGAGAGKTMQELAVAQTVSYYWRQPVLIITERQGIIDDAFAKDAETLGIPLWQYKQGPLEPGQNVLIATYFDVALGKVPLDLFQNVIFDEAHNLRGAGIATKAHVGIKLAEAAQRVLFATATPLDKPEQLWYLKSLLEQRPELALLRVGINTAWRVERGRMVPIFTPVDGVTDQQIEGNMERMFDDIYRRGQGIKREVPLDNLTVNLKRVVIDGEKLQAVQQIMAAADKYYRTLGVPERNIRGLVMMAGRGALESHKALEVIKDVGGSLKAGKQAIVFAYRVQEGLWGGGVTGLQAIADILEKQYGVGAVARLFGGGTSLKDRRYQQQALAAFNDGRIKIMVGSPGQAGTGINLDDIHGDAPRETFLITPPFSALEMVQMAGRTNRLTTASPAAMTVYITNTGVDTWNLDITLRKLRLLRASVKGGIDQLTPQPINEPTPSFQLQSKGVKPLDPRQVEFNFQAAVHGLGVPAGKALVPLSTGWPRSLKLYARAFKEDLSNTGQTSLTGQNVSNLYQFAVAAQMGRNLSFENNHWVISRDGVVLKHVITTVQHPYMTMAFPLVEGRPDASYINDLVAKLGADAVDNFHNHPSGEPTPSSHDVNFEIMARTPTYYDAKLGRDVDNPYYVPLLRHVIVIDHKKFREIHYGKVLSEAHLPGHTGRDPLLNPEGPKKAILNREVPDVQALFEVAKAASLGDGSVSLFFTSTRSAMRSFATVNIEDLRKVPMMQEWLRDMAMRMGASNVFAHYAGPEDVLPLAQQYHREGYLTEFILEGPHGWQPVSATLPGVWKKLQEAGSWMGVNKTPIWTQLIVQEKSEYNADTFKTRALSYSAASGYRQGVPATKGTTPVTLGGMQYVKPVAMPEILKLAQALMGRLPELKKLRGPRGVFRAGGPTGLIQIDFRIFRNQIDAAKTIAHEVGHAIDYLPDQFLQRGNLKGRLYSLRNFLLNKFGPSNVTNKELRAELIALTKFWKPWDEDAVSDHFNAYRKSAVELYADALSVLLNSPGLLEQMAPNFYREFWDALDAKPNVKAALFNLQDFLDRGLLNTLETRHGEIDTMFRKGEEIFKRKAEERELRRSSWKGFWLRLGQTWMDRYAPAISLQKEAEKAGVVFGKADPRRILDELGLKNNVNQRLVRTVFETVVKPLEDIGISQEDIGQVLVLDRILAGDRSGVANPLGQTPETARLQLAHLQRTLGFGAGGLSRMTLLRAAVQKFHDLVYPIVEEAVAVGSYNRAAFESTIKPNKDFYAAFAVLDYLEDFLPAGLRKQIGTFKEVANPFTATLLKAIAINNLNQLQKGKNVVIDNLLLPHFPGEIAKAKTTGFGPSLRSASAPVGKASLVRLENGVPTHYHVDPMIAEMFEKLTPIEINPIVRVLDVSFRKIFYPMFITYNPAFMLFLSPMRDFKRTLRNLPGGLGPRNPLRLAAEYVKNFMEARARYKGVERDPNAQGPQRGDLTREMEAVFAIAPPFDTFAQQHRTDFLGDVMRRYKLLPEPQQGFLEALFRSKPLAPVRFLAEKVELYGMILDSLPKYSAYRILTRSMGMAPRDAAGWVRNYAGLPNIHAKGTQVNVARALVPFFNVCLQGWRADARLMTQPNTRGGWWVRWAMRDGFWAVLTGLASAGLLGAVLKDLFGGASEYDRTNYQVVPLGSTLGGNGDFGKRVTYLRIPRDETSRMLSGILYAITSRLGGEPKGLPAELLDFGAGQLPNMNPVLSVTEKWFEYAEGINPTDPFKGKPIIGDTQFRAGGWDSLKPMFQWTLNESGVGNFVRYDPNAQTTLEMTLGMAPGLNRVLKTTDYGYREAQMAVEKEEASLRAAIALKMPDNAQGLLHEYMHLRSIDPPHRTEQQETRLNDLGPWYSQIYRRADQAIRDALGEKDNRQADALREALKADSKDYQRKK